MLKEVVLQTSAPMSFLIDDVDSDEILILKSISGLTPQKVTQFTGDFATNGGYYQGRRVGARYPVFNFKINPNYAADIEVSDIREMLYRQFYEPTADSDAVQVLLKDDRKPDRFFNCYAETWNGEIFERKPEASINTTCVDAFIQSVAITSESNSGGWLTVPLVYDGTADTGLELTLKVVSATSTIKIENNNQLMTLAGTFAANDIITIGTVEGNRYIRQNGVDKMVLLQAPAQWITLKQASNLLRVYGAAAGDGKVVATAYSFRAAWWGI